MRRRSTTLIASLITICLLTEVAMAQEPTKSPEVEKLEARIAELEKQKELLEKEKDLLDANRALEEAKAGPSSTALETEKLTERLALLVEQQKLVTALKPTLPQGLEGSITIDDNQFIEAQIAAYTTLQDAADEIARRIAQTFKGANAPKTGEAAASAVDGTPADPSVTILVTGSDLEGLEALALLEKEVEALTNQLKNHAPDVADLGIDPLLVVGPLLQTAADVAALFRTDTEFKARTIAIADEALIAAVAGRLSGVRHYPGAFPSSDWNLAMLRSLDDQFRAAKERHQKAISSTPADELARKRIEGFVTEWEQLEPRYKAFRDALGTRDPQTGTTPLAVVSRAAWLRDALKKTPRVVMLKVLHAGGTYVLTKRFWRGATLAQSGGLIVQFMVFDGAGQLLDAGTVQRIRTFANLEVAQSTGATQ